MDLPFLKKEGSNEEMKEGKAIKMKSMKIICNINENLRCRRKKYFQKLFIIGYRNTFN